jgi:REP element-mobilizing transposase RayT
MFWQRRLPHWNPDGSTVFVTWRLAGTKPQPARALLLKDPDPGRAFARQDYELGRAKSGPQWLKDPQVAEMFVKALHHGQMERQMYHLFAWVLMPNHVHVVCRPIKPLSEILRWLKSATGNRANQLIGHVGQRFWQWEYYDHWIRSEPQLWKVIRYVEQNPVSAGLVAKQEDWPWSSAAKCTGG